MNVFISILSAATLIYVETFNCLSKTISNIYGAEWKINCHHINFCNFISLSLFILFDKVKLPFIRPADSIGCSDTDLGGEQYCVH